MPPQPFPLEPEDADRERTIDVQGASLLRDSAPGAEAERFIDRERRIDSGASDSLKPSAQPEHAVDLLQAELGQHQLELAALRGQLEALTRRVAEDLRLASKVQRSLQPSGVHHPRLDLAREFIPFREVGGDYYDVVPLSEDHVALAIGDVMGKGVPAALLAATLTATVRSQIQAGQSGAADLVRHVNRLFWQVTPPGLFASLFFAILDMRTGLLEYVNAGHHYPFVVRPDGSSLDLTEGGTVLGLIEDACYRDGRLRLQASDLLVLYSDGITDRNNREGDLYGVERLKEAAHRSRFDPARICLYSILGDVQGWSEGTPAEDDSTLIVARIR